MMAEHDIETVRRFYAELLAFEARMEAAGDQMHNRDRWLEAERHLWKARERCQHSWSPEVATLFRCPLHQGAQSDAQQRTGHKLAGLRAGTSYARWWKYSPRGGPSSSDATLASASGGMDVTDA